jgi:hypothetical protein
MEMDEAIPILVVGFMALIGFWLAGLTYLMFKNQKREQAKEEDLKTEEEPTEDKPTKDEPVQAKEPEPAE